MNEGHFADEMHEIERYEFDASPPYRFDLNRRQFLKIFGGGVAVAFVFGDALALQQSRRRSRPELPQDIGAWLHIQEDGAIKVYTGKVEVGQNIRTSLSQAVAEELRTSIESIEMVMGDTDLTPYDRGTFGSQTTPIMSPQLRKVAAATRELLLDLAAKTLTVDRDELTISDGHVTHPASKRSLTFGQLTKGQKLLETVTDDELLTHADKWTIAGTSVRKVNGRDFVTGKHRYTSDMKLTGMLYGKVLRPPAFKATLVSLDPSAAQEIRGVTVVHDGNFVGVAAPTEESAVRALALIKAEWRTVPQPSKAELFEYLKANPREVQGRGGRSTQVEGSIADGLAIADKTLKQTFTVDYIAHAPLEPRAALAQWLGDKLTVWTGTQRPFGVRAELAEAFHIPEERVRVIMPDTGSGYGGKHTGEAAVEAARLAKAAGKGVKLVWTREEEFTWAYFRPAGIIEINSGVRSDGTLTAWEFHNYNSGRSAIRGQYEVPNQHIKFHPVESPLRQGSYRVLAATANIFARESQMDDLAHLLDLDPLQFRLQNLRDERFIAVLQAAAKKFGWGKQPKPNHGFGIAGGFEKGGYVATCAEVSVDPVSKKVKVIRVVEAFECGAIINPDHLRNQIEGAVVQGLGGALFESINFEQGRILNPRFSEYRVPRFSDLPQIDVVMLNRKDLPSAGAGETPIAGVAPAVGNAISNATGIRLRSLPLVPNGLET